MNFRKHLRVLPLVAIAMAGTPALAQETDAAATPEAGAPEGGLGEIIVTARRREESLSKVPASIVALSAESLRAQNVVSEIDLQRTAPGLTVKEGLSSNQLNFAIRGQSVDPFTTSPSAVLAYINEVQVSGVGASAFFDLQSVQVLKGPQGTLFGKNTTGGAVLFETRKPGDSFGGYVQGRIGNFDSREIEGALDIPLAPDTAALRIGGQYRERDGYIKNLLRDETIGDNESFVLRGTLELTPGDRIKNTLMVQYGETKGTASGILYSVNPCGGLNIVSAAACAYSPANPGFTGEVAANPVYGNGSFSYKGQTFNYGAGLESYAQFQKDVLGPYKVLQNSPSNYKTDSLVITNATTVDLSDQLVLKNIFGYTKSKNRYFLDVDGSPYAIFEYYEASGPSAYRNGREQISEELQLQGDFDRFDFVAGLQYAQDTITDFIPQSAFNFPAVAPRAFFPLDGKVKDKTWGVFGQASYEITDKLKVTGGFRYTWVKTTVSSGDRSYFYDFGYDGTPLRNKADRPSWLVGLDYQATSSLLLYAVHRGSWRTGGFNGFSFPNTASFEVGGTYFRPEKTKDIEAGLKFNGYLGSMPARLNIAGYYAVTKDVQRELAIDFTGTGAPGAYTVNIPESKVKGIELEAEIQPAEWLRIGGQLAYTDAKFSKPDLFVNNILFTAGPYPDTPELAGSVFAQIFAPIPEEAGKLSLRGDFYAQSKTFFSSFNNSVNPGTQLKSYELLNARIDWSNIYGSGFSVAVFGNNLTKEVYYTGGLANGQLLGVNNAQVGMPRTYGVELRFEF